MVSRTSSKLLKVFATSSAKHIAKTLPFPKGKYTFKKFSDGELYIRINEEVKNQTVWVLSSTSAPAEHLLELLFLLDALLHAGAKIKLLLTYYGYARQDLPKIKEARSGELIAKILKKLLLLKKVYVVHMHSDRLRATLPIENIIPFSLYASFAKRFDGIVAPDKGAIPFAKKLADLADKPLIVIHKKRPIHEKVKIVSVLGEVRHKRLLVVDDMITTGNTVLAASTLLHREGAQYIEVLATHGLFTNGALKRIEKSPIRKVTVTSSFLQKKKSKKLRVISLSSFIKEEIEAHS